MLRLIAVLLAMMGSALSAAAQAPARPASEQPAQPASNGGDLQPPALASSFVAPPTVKPRLVADPGCRDFKRRPIRILEVEALGDAGRAEFIGSGPVIKVDPKIMGSLPEGLQLFFHLHECAHHALGHLFAPTIDSEKEADCWAVKEGIRRRSFTPAEIANWNPYFVNSRGSAMHLPGPQRVAFIAACAEAP